MKINRVDHIGIAVPNLQEAKKFYEETLGIKITIYIFYEQYLSDIFLEIYF